MKIVDLNVLLYTINRDTHHHLSALKWWERALGDDEPIGLTWVVLNGFLRISTNPKFFPQSLSPDQAMAKVEAWLSHANTRVVLETERHWRILKRLLETAGTAGNLTTDAHLAALAISYGAALVSYDSDFSRFQELRWENPLNG